VLCCAVCLLFCQLVSLLSYELIHFAMFIEMKGKTTTVCDSLCVFFSFFVAFGFLERHTCTHTEINNAWIFSFSAVTVVR
jgi:hypothetical protein